ncbi:MAG: hypothetical protein MN733_01575, partial [Nitrososphaera sp.]|nr:hypothetical protein [Nitrososphaera sp.]
TFDGQFVYDIDDNLLGAPAYRPQFSPEWCVLIQSLLRQSGAIVTTSARLTASLQRLSGIQIEHKTVIAPNVTDKVELLPGKAEPDALLIASSDHLPLTKSMQPFLRAIRTFTHSHGLPIVYIGSPVNDLSRFGLHVHATGMLSYNSYREYIRRHNLIAVAPLEAWGDIRTQDFINSKSDVKMVEFGSTGVPSVYANVPPYRETPLSAGPLVDMRDEEALVSGLEDVYRNTERWRIKGSESVATHRMARDVVGGTWFRAIQNTRLNVPFELAYLLDRYKQYSKFSRELAVPKEMFDEADYLANNEDLRSVSDVEKNAYEHYLTKGIESGRTWFPGSEANAQELMLRVRENVFKEQQSLKDLEMRVAQAIEIAAPQCENEEHTTTALVEHASFWKRLRLTTRKLALKCGWEKYPPLFDQSYYLEEYPDVRKSGIDPYLHYVLHGISEKRNPNRYFNTGWYLERNPDADRADVDPLDHYLREGPRQGLDPGPDFSTRNYLDRHPDVEKSGMNPLEHFLKFRQLEGRIAKKRRP